MLAATIRSGLVESTHPWSAVLVDSDARQIGVWGDHERPFFYRSAIKALQATVSLEAGARLDPEHLAVACSSHSGTPAHLSIVAANLEAAGLDASALRCPPAWPLSRAARERVVAAGDTKRPIFHNCSGKHAGFLMACVAAGWPTDSYVSPDHPLQRRVIELVAATTGVDPLPTGLDGCGAPTLRGNLTGLATAFARLTVDPRFDAVRTATARYPALTSGNERPDGRLGMWWGGPTKGGAEGLMVAARNGVAIATKSHEGSIDVAVQALIEIGRRTGLLGTAATDALADIHRPVVLGGGRPAGVVVPDVDLEPA